MKLKNKNNTEQKKKNTEQKKKNNIKNKILNNIKKNMSFDMKNIKNIIKINNEVKLIIMTMCTQYYISELDIFLKSIENDTKDIIVICFTFMLTVEQIQILLEKYKFLHLYDMTHNYNLVGKISELQDSDNKKIKNIIKLKPYFINLFMILFKKNILWVDSDIIFVKKMDFYLNDLFNSKNDIIVPKSNRKYQFKYYAGIMFFKYSNKVIKYLENFTYLTFIEKGVKNWFFEQIVLFKTLENNKKLKIKNIMKNVFARWNVDFSSCIDIGHKNEEIKAINTFNKCDIYFICPRNQSKSVILDFVKTISHYKLQN
jgi:hypothetical protein